MASKLSLFLVELKRRKVYHVGAVYVVVGLGIIAAAEGIFPALNLEWAQTLVVILVLLGFPIALVLAWAYEVKPEEPRAAEPSRTESSTSLESASRHPLSAPAQRMSIVVLPFDNMSPDPGDAYLSDGLTEEIITHLSHIRSLRVISRSSAMVLKGTQKDVRTIGRELEVQYVLEGSVRKVGQDLRITAQLIDAANDEHLWADKYDGVLEDVFGMQERVARAIVGELSLGLTPSEERFIERRTITDLPAYECYLKARQHVWQGTADSLDRAVKDLDTAMRLVGDNSLLHAVLGYVYFQKVNFGYEHEEAIERARHHAMRALELDEECVLAEVVVGATSQALLGDQRSAVHHLEKARQLDPNNPDAVIWLLNAYLLLGQMDRARALADLVVRLDPLNPAAHAMRGFTYLHEGNYDLAVSSGRRAYEMDPAAPHIAFLFSMALAYGGHAEELSEVRDRIEPSDSSLTSAAYMLEAATRGDVHSVQGQITEDVAKTAQRDCQLCWFIAGPLAKVGAVDQALEWMERALNQGFINYHAISIDPFLGALRDEPRYLEFLERVRREWEAFEL